ncbi:metallopeptidase TldD-related protein [Abyssibius alkaniclasticus]|uniref:TldD/PmbA family protein n=1 Tax=Abyssibius alkaniclasticus TaxID=2881234 RepID=UPI0023643882|nr:metallopeptidase TldD-related protein [Abyssibius alkaniclasticus]UPH71672.1 metallopeptidase TldD-related protein [Abyssibius alkaniclasticus]
MPHNLQALAEKALAAAKAAGAGAADVLAVAGDSLSIEVRQGALEHAERAEGVDLGLRVLIGKRQACISISDIRDDAIETAAARAVAMARLAPEDAYCGLADPDQLSALRAADGLELEEPGDAPNPADLQALACQAEAAALAVKGVAQVQSAGADWSRHNIWLAASNGFSGGYARSSHSLAAVAISGTGTAMERDWAAESRIFKGDMPSAEDIGQRAGARAVARSGPRKPPTGAYPVLYDERVASGLIGHLLSAINGAAIARGASWLRDALGEAVLPEGMDLVENPRRARSAASRPFDAEGLPTHARSWVEDGRLQGYVLDLATARKLGMDATGNAARGTGGPPAPSTTNLALTQGSLSREDLLREMGTGLLITSLIGSSINATTGDYSRGASGFWVENGEIAGPVNECTVAGNLRPMLASLIAGNDAQMHKSHQIPSLLVEGLTIAGA